MVKWIILKEPAKISLEDDSKIYDFQDLKNVEMSHFDYIFTEHDEVDPIVTVAMMENIPTITSIDDNVNSVKPIEETNILNDI